MKPPPTGLRHLAAKSLIWSWSGVALLIILQIAYASTISRLVPPESFGLIAVGMLAVRYVNLLARFGVEATLIQRSEVSETDLRTANTLAILGGTFGMFSLYFAAPVVASVLNQPDSIEITRWLALAVFLAGLGVVPAALLKRTMRFKALSVISVFSYLISNIMVGVAAAVYGWDVGALLLVNISNVLLNTLAWIYVARWRPTITFRNNSFRHFGRVGGHVSAASLLDSVGETVDTALVGRIGSEQLGQYSRASFLVGLPIGQTSAAATRVTMPTLGRMQDDHERFGSALGLALGLTALTVLVPVAGAAATAPILVPLVLGDGWELATQVLPIVGAAQGIRLITQVVTSAAEATGAVTERLKAQVISLLFYAAILFPVVVFMEQDATDVAWAWLGGECCRLVVHLLLAIRQLHVKPGLLLRRFGSVALLAAAAAGPGVFLIRIGGLDSIPILGLTMALSALSFGAVWVINPDPVLRSDVTATGVLDAVLRKRSKVQ